MTGWPVGVDFAVSWAAGPSSTPVQDSWLSLTGRTEGSVRIGRGKQYELDQIQPGTLTVTLRNDDGVFDPSNGSSPYAGFVLPYRLIRARAQYPATANQLTPDQASAGAASGLPLGTLPQWVQQVNVGYTVTTVAGRKYACTTPASYSGARLIGFTGWSVVPGATYSAQVKADCPLGSPQVRLRIFWLTASGALISTSDSSFVTTSPVQQLVTVTGTAPANAAGAALYCTNESSGVVSVTIYFASVQLELAAAPTTYGLPGTWYPMFTGYVERWPQAWSAGGNYGVSSVTAVDLFAFLANRGMNWPYYFDVLSLGPQCFYPLDEGSGAKQWADMADNNPSMLGISYPRQITPKVAAGSPAVAASSVPLGLPGPVVTFTNPVPAGSQSTEGSGLDFMSAAGGEPAASGWSLSFAFRSTVAPSNSDYAVLWECNPDGAAATFYGLAIGSSGSFYPSGTGVQGALGIVVYVKGTSITNTSVYPLQQVGSQAVNDGNWHHVVLTMAANGLSMRVYLDGVLATTVTNGTDMRVPFGSQGLEVFGIDIAVLTKASKSSYSGDMAVLARWTSTLSPTQASLLYHSFTQAWGTGGSIVETSDSRYSRILAWINNAAPVRISAGDSVQYGPATDFEGGSSPTSTLAALQAIVDSECGQHYIAADGTLVFEARSDRFSLTSVQAFGEQAGEVAYQQAATDFDPTRVANDVTTTVQNQASAAASTAHVADAASQADYGTMTMSRTINTVDPVELEAVAEGLLYQYRQPLQRLQSIPVNVGANPSYWPLLLALELGACVQVTRRPSNAPAITITGFLEQIGWQLSDTGQVVWTAQVSGNAAHQFCVLDSATFGVLDSTAILGF